MLIKYFAIKRSLVSENLNDENKKIWFRMHFIIKYCKLRHVAWLISNTISEEFHCKIIENTLLLVSENYQKHQ